MQEAPAFGATLCDSLLFRVPDGSAAGGGNAGRPAGISLGDFKRRQGKAPSPGALPSFLDATPGLKRKVFLMVAGLVLTNVGLVAATVAVSTRYPALISPAILAYTFGLRHAVDADHLAAIDNMTRQLMADGQRPVTVGLYFSLGHSTIVFILSFVVAIATSWLKGNVSKFQAYGTIVGTTISAVFLLLIGLVNLWILVGLVKRWRALRAGTAAGQAEGGSLLGAAATASGSTKPPNSSASSGPMRPDEEVKIGFMNRLCPWISRVVDTPWKMYPVGVLFGLGFDTATEVALLAISAAAPGEGIPIGLIMLLPSLFTAGMALVDTLDGILMLWAYGWAFVDPGAKRGSR
jgi:high-affinity nickel-transport protein